MIKFIKWVRECAACGCIVVNADQHIKFHEDDLKVKHAFMEDFIKLAAIMEALNARTEE